jgi:predicted metal-dependent enzyme (double-stranded beta helix superfamily)
MGGIVEERKAAAAALIAEARAIEHRHGVTREALEKLKALLIALAAKAELFPLAQFPLSPEGTAALYLLAQGPDDNFALYAASGVAGQPHPPIHNHTTWAVIAGVAGKECNHLYERTDDRSTPGKGILRHIGDVTVTRGSAVGFLPDDFHTVEAVGDGLSLHLHLYGRSLEKLPDRIYFVPGGDGAYKTFANPPKVRSPVLA